MNTRLDRSLLHAGRNVVTLYVTRFSAPTKQCKLSVGTDPAPQRPGGDAGPTMEAQRVQRTGAGVRAIEAGSGEIRLTANVSRAFTGGVNIASQALPRVK